MKRRKTISHEAGSGTVWRVCPVCSKTKAEAVGKIVRKQWVCSQRCADRLNRAA